MRSQNINNKFISRSEITKIRAHLKDQALFDFDYTTITDLQLPWSTFNQATTVQLKHQSASVLRALRNTEQTFIIEVLDKKPLTSLVILMPEAGSTVNVFIRGEVSTGHALYFVGLPAHDATVGVYGTISCSGQPEMRIQYAHTSSGSAGYVGLGLDCTPQANVSLFARNHHAAKNTTGDITIKTIGQERSAAEILGWVTVAAGASNTNSFLHQDTLLLSPDSNIRTIPNLQIAHHDVKASHGATVGYVDPAALYYMSSRGITSDVATQMIANGFLKSLSTTVRNKTIAQLFKEAYV